MQAAECWLCTAGGRMGSRIPMLLWTPSGLPWVLTFLKIGPLEQMLIASLPEVLCIFTGKLLQMLASWQKEEKTNTPYIPILTNLFHFLLYSLFFISFTKNNCHIASSSKFWCNVWSLFIVMVFMVGYVCFCEFMHHVWHLSVFKINKNDVSKAFATHLWGSWTLTPVIDALLPI
jgi:hypothetical protein